MIWPNAMIEEKLAAVDAALRAHRRVVVAFSGGVDSTVLLKLAVRALGADNVLAITGQSASVPSAERDSVAALAAECGAAHDLLATSEFEDPRYVANPTNRCYFCKTELYSRLVALAAERGYDVVLAGTNADDLGDYRPGLTAASELGVEAPLAAAGMTKADVRAVGAALGVSIADKPASPCLSSRVPYGQAVTVEKLARIDAAETYLRELGFGQCRVRHHEELARIEVPVEQLPRFAEAEFRRAVDEHFRTLGFKYVTLDLRGFRSGSLNEVLMGPGLAGVSSSE